MGKAASRTATGSPTKSPLLCSVTAGSRSARSPMPAYHAARTCPRDDGGRRLRAMAVLSDLDNRAPSLGRPRWGRRGRRCLHAFEERVASGVAMEVERSLHLAEVEKACAARIRPSLAPGILRCGRCRLRCGSRAPPRARALELLERAMELAPQDALPVALAAWCHGNRTAHVFTAHPSAERQRASGAHVARGRAQYRRRESGGVAGGGSHTGRMILRRRRSIVIERFALDGGCVWAWNRSGWLNIYHGLAADAIECFQIARSLGPTDPLNFFCSIGIAAAHFEIGGHDEAAHWFARGRAEHPQAVWSNRFRAPAPGAGRPERGGAAELCRTRSRLSRTDHRGGQAGVAEYASLLRSCGRGTCQPRHAPLAPLD